MSEVEVKAELGMARRVRIDCGGFEVFIEVRPKEPQAVEERPVEARLALVLDQTHRGYSSTLERHTPQGVEIHEVGGVGVAEPVKVSSRTYRHPASDDYDVLRLLESLSQKFPLTLFITGDKTLSEEARMLKVAKGLNVEVRYMPPSDYLGKEAILQAIIDQVNKLLSSMR
ncbi:MAG: hypothetical protein DRJ69_06475 [Thermoprotei archaeon]|nr:MAG: hypothetical protein DRJ69_06475 [Thermoprotei archaeon]